MASSVSVLTTGGTALDIAGWITLKSVVDGFGGNSSTNDWPVAACGTPRQAVEMQMLDAAPLLLLVSGRREGRTDRP